MNSPTRFGNFIHYVALLGVIAALGACSGEQSGDEQSTPTSETTTTETSDGSGVSVSADKTHAVQPGDEITVTVAVTDALDAKHYRVYLDDASGEDFLAEGNAETVKVTVPESITDGSHQLRVVLYNDDGTPVVPPAQGDVWLIVYRL